MRRDDRRDDRREHRDRSRDRHGRDDRREFGGRAGEFRRDDRGHDRGHARPPPRDRSRSRSRSPGGRYYRREPRPDGHAAAPPRGNDDRGAAAPFGSTADAPQATGKRQGDPISLEELISKRAEREAASNKPAFISKKDREAAALQRRAEEVAAKNVSGKEVGTGGGASAASQRASYDHRDLDKFSDRGWGGGHGRGGYVAARRDFGGHDSGRDDHARSRELELIRAQHMGGVKVKKKPTKPSDKFKFKFDWDKDQDTSVDLNPLYSRPCEVSLAFGRGGLGGVDRRVVASEGAQRQMALVSKSRRDLGERMTADETSQVRSATLREDALDAKQATDARAGHWSEKALDKMTERDWRIFREDHSITTKGGRLPMPMRSWAEASMPDEIVRAIKSVGYDKPSPIQMASIPIGLLKRDVIGVAETGSGKTCAFVVPMLAYIMDLPVMTEEIAMKGPYALIMAPTRELAQQIEVETEKFARYLNYRVVSVVGGQDIEQQGFKLRKGCEIVIGTPGRIIDVLDKRYTVLQQCNFLVLDEADRMIDMGFEPQVVSVMEGMSADSLKPLDQAEALDLAAVSDSAKTLGTQYRMTYMFSATMPPSVERLARTYLRNPAVVNIGSAGKTSDLIKQLVRWTTRNQKIKELEQTLAQFNDTQAIVFVNTKKSVDFLCASIGRLGYSVQSLHGGKTQDLREGTAGRGFPKSRHSVYCPCVTIYCLLHTSQVPCLRIQYTHTRDSRLTLFVYKNRRAAGV